MRKICIEEHWGTPETEELRMRWLKSIVFRVTLDSEIRNRLLQKMWSFEARLPVMDEYGIAVQVISLSSPGVQGIADPREAVYAAKKLNDAQAELIHKYPDRFAGFAALPLQSPKEAADELERAVTQLGFRGAMIHGHTHGEYLDAEKFRVVWERAEALNAPLYLHVNEPMVDQMKIYQGRPELLGPTWCWGVETATHALRIIFGGMFDAYPKAALILDHMGESLPYVLGRLDEGFTLVGGKKSGKLKKMPSEYFRENVWITTSGKFFPETLQCAIRAIGADRILFATDYPFADTREAVEQIENSPVGEEDKERIFHLNAERLLGL